MDKSAEFQTEILNENFDEEERWHSEVEAITEILHKGTTTTLPPEQQEELERSNQESFRAAQELLQGEQDQKDASQRKKQKKKEKKERKARKGKDSDSEESRKGPTAILLPFVAPPEESSDKEDAGKVIRRLQFGGLPKHLGY